MSPGELRIIAGTLRRRRIRVPRGLVVRPTPERVREALFDILGPAVEGARVLDAFAGSGALGLEALSRGAAGVVFVERERIVLDVLRSNVDTLGVEDLCRVVSGAVEEVLGREQVRGPFDLVLADPPYEEPLAGPFLRLVSAVGFLSEGARVVVERDQRTAAVTQGIERLLHARTVRYGRTCLDFYRPGTGSVPVPETT